MRQVLASFVLLAAAWPAAAQRCSGPGCSPAAMPTSATAPGWVPGWVPAAQYPGWECFWDGAKYTHWLNARTGEMLPYGNNKAPARPKIGSRPYAPYLDPTPDQEPAPAPTYTGWAQSMYYQGWYYWWWNGAHRFAFQPDRNEFCAYDGKIWSQPRPWPYEIRPELPGYKPATPRLNFGVDQDRMHGERPSAPLNFGVDEDQLQRRCKGRPAPCEPNYRINGQPVSRDDAAAAIAGGAPSIPDDSGKRWLVAVSKDRATRDRIAQDLESSPTLAELRSQVRFQPYDDPTHWQLAGYKLQQDARFQRSGVGLFLVDPPGPGQQFGAAVAARYSYEGPEALRRIDPAFDPNKVPDGSSSGNPLDQVLKLLGLKDLNIGIILLALAGVGVIVYFVRRKRTQTPSPPSQNYATLQTPSDYRPRREPPSEPASLGELAHIEVNRRRRRREEEELHRKIEGDHDAALRELLKPPQEAAPPATKA
jgi:hypothetical protein